MARRGRGRGRGGRGPQPHHNQPPQPQPPQQQQRQQGNERIGLLMEANVVPDDQLVSLTSLVNDFKSSIDWNLAVSLHDKQTQSMILQSQHCTSSSSDPSGFLLDPPSADGGSSISRIDASAVSEIRALILHGQMLASELAAVELELTDQINEADHRLTILLSRLSRDDNTSDNAFEGALDAPRPELDKKKEKLVALGALRDSVEETIKLAEEVVAASEKGKGKASESVVIGRTGLAIAIRVSDSKKVKVDKVVPERAPPKAAAVLASVKIVDHNPSADCVICFDTVQHPADFRSSAGVIRAPVAVGPSVQGPLLGCKFDCSHVFCDGCIVNWVQSAIKDRANKFPLKCAVPDCATDFVNTQHPRFSRLLEYNGILEEVRKVELLSPLNKPVYCPSKKCLAIFESPLDETEKDMVAKYGEEYYKSACPLCHIAICLRCNVEYHNGFTCTEYDQLPAEDKHAEDLGNYLTYKRGIYVFYSLPII